MDSYHIDGNDTPCNEQAAQDASDEPTTPRGRPTQRLLVDGDEPENWEDDHPDLGEAEEQTAEGTIWEQDHAQQNPKAWCRHEQQKCEERMPF